MLQAPATPASSCSESPTMYFHLFTPPHEYYIQTTLHHPQSDTAPRHVTDRAELYPKLNT